MRIGINAWAFESDANFKNAGISRCIRFLVPALAKAGPDHEFVVYMLPRATPPEEWKNIPNLKIKNTWKKYRLWVYFGEWSSVVTDRLDVWYSVSNRLPKWAPCKKASLVYDLFPFRYPEFYPESDIPHYNAIFPPLCREADLVLTISEATKREVIDLFGVDEAKVVPAPIGPGNLMERHSYDSVSTEDLRAAGVPFDKYFYVVSTVEPRKNMARLFEAFALASKDSALDGFGLVVSGGKGWKDDAIFDRVAQLGMTDRICFTGYMTSEQLAQLYGRCEAFICASIDEGFGMPLLEAMLMGAPTLSSNRGALPEVGGDVARYFDPLNVEEMAQALVNYIREAPDRTSLVERGLKQAAKFSWDRHAKITLESMEARFAR